MICEKMKKRETQFQNVKIQMSNTTLAPLLFLGGPRLTAVRKEGVTSTARDGVVAFVLAKFQFEIKASNHPFSRVKRRFAT